MTILEWVLAGLFGAIGLRAALRTTQVEGATSGADRMLLAVHDAARAGFWFALAGLFAGFALMDDPRAFTWFALTPIGMAALRLLAAAGLSRAR